MVGTLVETNVEEQMVISANCPAGKGPETTFPFTSCLEIMTTTGGTSVENCAWSVAERLPAEMV